MKRDFLKNLGLEDENIDKIMAELGKEVNADKSKLSDLEEKLNSAKESIETYKTKITELESVKDDSSKIQQELDNLKQQIADKEAEEKAKKDDEILTNNIIASFGDKQFINDYTKNAIISDIKKALKDENNAGKSSKDIFEEITNGKDEIFANPNQFIPNMSGVDETMENSVSKEAFEKMGYKERLELKQSNPELFNKYNQ